VDNRIDIRCCRTRRIYVKRKALTRDRTDHFGNVFCGDLELWPMTLTFEFDVDRMKLNQRAKYPRQKPFDSKLVVRTPTCSVNSSFHAGRPCLPDPATAWDGLPSTLEDSTSLLTFRRDLKTFLFMAIQLGRQIHFCSCGFYLLIFFLEYSQRSQIGSLAYFHT